MAELMNGSGIQNTGKLKPKRLSYRKRRELKRILDREEHYRKTGIRIRELPVMMDNKKGWFFLTNALITFLLVMGSAGVCLSAFEVRFYDALLILYAIVLSLFVAFLYWHFALRIIGYIASFAGFIWVFFYERYRIRGGFAYMLNRLMKVIEEKFSLPVEQSYNVYGFSEKSSVTVCVMFLLIISILLVNAAVTESKGFEWVFVMTFPLTQIGFYFDLKVNLFYYVMYLSGLISIYFLRSSSHCRMENRKRKGYTRRKRKNKVIYNYVNDGKYIMSFTLAMILLITVVSLIASVFYPERKFTMQTELDGLKARTRESVRKAAMVGFWGMVNPGGSAGGVDRNKMGQSRYVRLDYETDLLVKTAIEQGENTLYLSAFHGSFYQDAYWMTIGEYRMDTGDAIPSLRDVNLTSTQLFRLPQDLNEKIYQGKLLGKQKGMEVTNKDAAVGYYYRPYYLTEGSNDISVQMIDDDETQGGLSLSSGETFSYMPLRTFDSVVELEEQVKQLRGEAFRLAKAKGDQEVLELLDEEEQYSKYVHAVYLTVPEKNQSVIKEFCENYGLNEKTKDPVGRLAEIFQENYEYTLIPGKTPSKKDFVNYFLEESKKGYCTYFATAGTLIFRYLGIPARYTGGYVLPSYDFRSGTRVSESKLSENAALNQIPKDTSLYPLGVYEYELTDREAHAWVEIYVDGFGWVPVEVTPSSTGEEILNASEQENSLSEYLTETLFGVENRKRMKRASLNVLQTFFAVVVTLFFLYQCYGVFLRIRRKRSSSVVILYDYLSKCLGFLEIRREPSMSYEEFGRLIIQKNEITPDKVRKLTRLFEKEKFSGEVLSGEEIRFAAALVFETRDAIYQNLSLFDKFLYRWIRLL